MGFKNKAILKSNFKKGKKRKKQTKPLSRANNLLFQVRKKETTKDDARWRIPVTEGQVVFYIDVVCI